MALRPIEIRALWNLIPVPLTSGFNSYPFDPPFDGARLAIARDRRKHLLVRCDPEDQFEGRKGLISETTSSLAFDGHATSYLDVSLEEDSLSEEFDAFICDVLGDGELEAGVSRARMVHTGIERWRSLLRLAARRVMSPERRLGLFGELIMLDRLRSVVADPWRSWSGPLGKPHDIELDSWCLEVKTMGTASPHVRIHGLEQLLPDDRGLLLVIGTASEDPSGSTLAELAGRLKLEFASAEFDALLARTGWSDVMEPGPPLVIDEVTVVPITAAVPRLTPSDVPPGVFDVDYELSYETLREHAVSEDYLAIVGTPGVGR